MTGTVDSITSGIGCGVIDRAHCGVIFGTTSVIVTNVGSAAWLARTIAHWFADLRRTVDDLTEGRPAAAHDGEEADARCCVSV